LFPIHEKDAFAYQDLFGLPEGIYMEKKMGKRLGKCEILQ
jgi:hypothetical protein